jgi:SAM-dependent methyltransferase
MSSSAERVLQHRFQNPLSVAAQLLRGRSLTRALLNLALRRQAVGGRVLDLGAKSAKASYYGYLDLAPGASVVHTDLEAGPGVVALDVEARFPLADASFDAVLAFHLFEHVFDFTRAPGEVFRVLAPGGRALVATPFLHEHHADPHDYWRFTDTALRQTWESAGFRCVHLEAIGEGLLTTVATKLADQVLPRFLRAAASAALYLVLTLLDRLIALRPRIAGRSVPERFALEYLAVFEKPHAAARG